MKKIILALLTLVVMIGASKAQDKSIFDYATPKYIGETIYLSNYEGKLSKNESIYCKFTPASTGSTLTVTTILIVNGEEFTTNVDYKATDNALYIRVENTHKKKIKYFVILSYKGRSK